MEEINLRELLRYFLGKLVIIIIVSLVFYIFGFLYGMFIKVPMYNSYTTIVLTRTNEEQTEEGITQNDILLNQKLVSTYREIIKSRKILKQVINNLKLDITVEELGKLINVTNEQDTELLRISVNYTDGIVARNIANEIAKVFSNEIVNIYSIKNVSIIDYAEISVYPYNIHVTRDAIIILLIGFVLSSAVIFVMYYFDTTVKSATEIEEKIGLPVLGTVPMFSNDRGGRK